MICNFCFSGEQRIAFSFVVKAFAKYTIIGILSLQYDKKVIYCVAVYVGISLLDKFFIAVFRDSFIKSE